jgi:DnaJ homolog subfamily C member 7
MQKIKDIEYYINKANDCIKNKNYTEAKTQFELAFQLVPQSIQIKLYIIEVLIKLGNPEKAATDANEIIEKDDQNNSDAYFLRGKALYYSGNNKLASIHLSKCLELDPDYKKAQEFRKTIKLIEKLKEECNQLFKENQFEKAIEKYSEAINVDTKSVNASLYCNKGTCLIKLKKIEEAELDLSKSIDLDPNYYKALIRRGDCYDFKKI